MHIGLYNLFSENVFKNFYAKHWAILCTLKVGQKSRFFILSRPIYFKFTRSRVNSFRDFFYEEPRLLLEIIEEIKQD